MQTTLLALMLCGSTAYMLPTCRAPSSAGAARFRRALPPPQMNLGERFVRLVKSNVNQALSSLEDPEKVLEQAVADMQKDLVKVRQAYAEVSASSKRMTEQAKLAESEAAKWYSRAQLALEKGEDDLAREALTRRAQQVEMADNLKAQIEQQSGSITSLYESMKDLEAKMAEAKAKKDQIIARARTAKASTKVNDMLAGVGTGSSMAAFERMTEKVQQLEAEADVSKQLALSSPKSGAGSTLEAQFKQLEAGNSVDDELKAMKAALPSAVDDELAQMKKKLGQGKEEP
ncbi:hypothetical protein AB1Y20_021106 [Prymnesium parvum]|uniref:PspA/IM30 family protein n=1 Tax=Prymnesium parvum TaxID=97485 RepID=A0AB34JJG1_PRYPA